jgi:capsular exopolysaccharide synthesis family protein
METLLDELKQRRAKVETELAEAEKRYGTKHPKIIALYAQLRDVNSKIESESSRLLGLNEKMVQYNLLKKEAETNQQLYTTLLQRSKETGVSEKIALSNIRIVDAAKPPETPYKPKKSRDLMMALFLALGLGVSSAFFLEHLDSTIRTAEDVSHYLTLPFLGYIPAIHKEAKTDRDKGLFCFHSPRSTITESFRAVRTSILFASPEDKPLKLVMVTAAFPQEGKSFFSANLATIFSQVNEKVVLIDVDMRRPKLNKTFGLDIKPGLSNYLTGNAEINSIVRPTEVPNVSVITSGTIPPNPSELLTSNKIRVLLNELLVSFNRIILDTPPILSAPDSSLLSSIVDGVVLVVKGASTRLEAVVKAKERVLEAKGRIIGVVINNIQPEKEDRYYYYHYYYQEDKK